MNMFAKTGDLSSYKKYFFKKMLSNGCQYSLKSI